MKSLNRKKKDGGRLRGPALQRGVTLLEMAVVLAITGVLAGALIWVLFSRPQGSAAGSTDLTTVDNAIVGYALTHHALPPNGWLDPATIGLPPGRPVWYLGDPGLEASAPAYTPDPAGHAPQFTGADGTTISWQALRAALPANGTQSVTGMLDFCAILLRVQQSPQLTVAGIPAAFVIGSVRARNAAPPDVTALLPGTPQAQMLATQGSQVRAAGVGELLARLHCPLRLASAGGAAKAVIAAQNLTQVAQSLQAFRQLKYQKALYSQFSDDFQIGIRAGLITNLSADMVSSTIQFKAAIPDSLDALDPPTVAQLLVLTGLEVVLMESQTLQFEILSTIDPGMSQQNSDAASVQAASNALASAGRYVGQLQQLQQSRQNHYQTVIQGS